jgi:hypothetical protein
MRNEGRSGKPRRRRARGPPRSLGMMLRRADPPGSKAVWLRLSGKEGEEGSRGRPSSSPGEVATRPEAVEEVPTMERGLAEIAGTTTTTDPDPGSPVAGAVTGGGAPRGPHRGRGRPW